MNLRTGALAPLLALMLTGSGCQNACQQICGRMARYAEDCGLVVPPEELAACRDAQAGDASAEDRDVCREQGSSAALRDTWTCEELEAYWDDQAARRHSPSRDTAL